MKENNTTKDLYESKMLEWRIATVERLIQEYKNTDNDIKGEVIPIRDLEDLLKTRRKLKRKLKKVVDAK